MGTDGQPHKDEAEVLPTKSQTKQSPDDKEETESKADRKTAGLRCFQGNREISEEEPSELGAAVVTSSEPVCLVPQLISQPQYLDCDFDVELTAEVRVEDGSPVALLTTVTHNVGYQKPGSFLNGHCLLLRPSLRNKGGSVDCFLPSGPYPGWCSGVIQALEQIQLPCSLKTTERITETAKSPLPSSPSNSPSSPSSAPSSPSSSPSSSSPGTNYHVDEDRGRVGDNRASKGTGDFVSSTSSSLLPSSLSVPPSNTPLHASSLSTHSCNDGQREGVDNDIYDPFHPTEGEGEREPVSTEDEEEEVDKYDPFEPTGSPASETEEEKRCMDEENEGESSINSEGIVMKGNRKLEMEQTAETEGGPPDSTDVALSSMFNNVPFELNSKRSIKGKVREQGSNLRKTGTDSEHSEIEEGEIVGVNERGRERVIERRREVLLPSSSSPSYLQGSGPKPERILRVLEGDGFVSVRADEEWEREPVASMGVGDLRRKLTSRRKERFRSCPSSASISPSPASVLPLPLPSPPFPTSPTLSTGEGRSRKSSKSSKDRDRHKHKEGRGEKEKRKKRKERKESGEGNRDSRERDRGRENKEQNRDRGSSRSDSRKRKKRRHSSPGNSSHSHSQNASQRTHSHRSWSSHSEDHHKDNDRGKEKEKERDRNHERDRDRDRWRDDRRRETDRDTKKRDGQRRDRDADTRRSSSRERGSTKRSSDRRDREKEIVRHRDRDRRRDSRPVVPPSIQDLNGSDLFAIKRTITVTTTTTTTTVPSSPPVANGIPAADPTAQTNTVKEEETKEKIR